MKNKSFIFADGVLMARTVTNARAKRLAAGYKGDVRIVDAKKAQVVARNVSENSTISGVFKFLNGGK